MFPFNRVGGSQAAYGERRTKAQTLAEHRSALLELKRDLREGPCGHIANVATQKTNFVAACPLELCSSILIDDLVVGVTHRGSVLKVRLVTDAIKTQSVQTVLQDEAGDVVKVHIYNVPGLMPWATTKAGLASAQAMFPKGQQLAVIEPNFKLLLDGTYGVRVENPHEVLFMTEAGEPAESVAAQQAPSGGIYGDAKQEQTQLLLSYPFIYLFEDDGDILSPTDFLELVTGPAHH